MSFMLAVVIDEDVVVGRRELRLKVEAMTI